jgi:hypothetical protein
MQIIKSPRPWRRVAARIAGLAVALAAGALVLQAAEPAALASPAAHGTRPDIVLSSRSPARAGVPASANRRRLPAPPRKIGCYHYIDHRWRRADCESRAYVRQHFPHPEVLTGISSRVSKHGPPIVLSSIFYGSVAGGSVSDSQFGAAYSVQDNAFFNGNNNNAPDAVQFTDQVSKNIFGNYSNLICVWQVDIATQNYDPTCVQPPTNSPGLGVEGAALDGLLTVSVDFPLGVGNSGWAVVTPDVYGLQRHHRWDNISGSILGYGDGSEAVFSNSEGVVAVQASSCLGSGGFLDFAVACSKGSSELKKHAFTNYSPGPSTNGYQTDETNNLIPVLGKAPGYLPPISYLSDWLAAFTYGVSTTGHCWTGSLPYCE